jgi:hypothetical protein
MKRLIRRFRVRRSIDHNAVRDLLWDWDPIGDHDPTDPHLPANEYDWLIPDVLRRLESAEGTDELASFLTDAARTRYSIEPPPSTEVAARLVAWHASRRGEQEPSRKR